MKQLRLSFLCLAFIAGGGNHAAADTSDSTANRRYVGKLDSIQKISEVVIVGAPVIPKYREVIPAQVLKDIDLQRLNSFSVADAIRYFAGVQLKDYGGVGGLKTVNIRSMGTNHMAVFYDGIQLGNAQNGQVDLGRFSLDDVEEISLYNGQKSDIFQSAKDFGASGTIYITTRRPRFEEGKRANFKATMKTGSFGLINPSMRYEYKISDAVSSSFSGEWTNATGRYKSAAAAATHWARSPTTRRPTDRTATSTPRAWRPGFTENRPTDNGPCGPTPTTPNAASREPSSTTSFAMVSGCGTPTRSSRAR